MLHAPQWLLLVCVSTHARSQSVCEPEHTQRPATQLCPAPQLVPHAPQFNALVCRSTHVGVGAVGAQSVCPALHTGLAGTHAPATHCSFAAHPWLHIPQCVGSTCTSAHVVPQSVCPAPHMIAPVHTAATHVCPGAHVRPHTPQLSRFVCSSTHVPLQFVCVPVHITVDATHAPAAHIWPIAHAAPHEPQLLTSLCVLTQLAPHRVSFAAHAATTHALATHDCDAGHGRPHSPQCAPLVLVSTHVPPQSVCPSGHIIAAPHTPIAQRCPTAQA